MVFLTSVFKGFTEETLSTNCLRVENTTQNNVSESKWPPFTFYVINRVNSVREIG